MGIFIWTVFLFLNGIFATVNYKLENYKTAVFNAFATGISLIMLAQAFKEYYA